METGETNRNRYEEKVCEARTISESQSERIRPSGRGGPLIVKIPVVISQMRVHINIESKIRLDRPALDIRHCTRNVSITRCRLLDMGNKRSGKLYISGFVKEDIEYASEECKGEKSMTGELRYITVKIPFESSARVDYYMVPCMKKGGQMLAVALGEGSPGVQGEDILYCEFEDINVLGADLFRENSFSENYGVERCGFDTIVEHITVSLSFTLLQKQMVNIPKGF